MPEYMPEYNGFLEFNLNLKKCRMNFYYIFTTITAPVVYLIHNSKKKSQYVIQLILHARFPHHCRKRKISRIYREINHSAYFEKKI